MYDDLTAGFDEAEEQHGEIVGYLVMYFHADGSATIDATTDEGSEASRIVDQVVKGFEEAVQ
jgi:hypothetical protein